MLVKPNATRLADGLIGVFAGHQEALAKRLNKKPFIVMVDGGIFFAEEGEELQVVDGVVVPRFTRAIEANDGDENEPTVITQPIREIEITYDDIDHFHFFVIDIEDPADIPPAVRSLLMNERLVLLGWVNMGSPRLRSMGANLLTQSPDGSISLIRVGFTNLREEDKDITPENPDQIGEEVVLAEIFLRSLAADHYMMAGGANAVRDELALSGGHLQFSPVTESREIDLFSQTETPFLALFWPPEPEN